MMTLTTRMTTTEDVITAMTMAMTMQGMVIITAMTTFSTTTITLGLPTTTIGAVNVDSRLPPSFPLSSFAAVIADYKLWIRAKMAICNSRYGSSRPCIFSYAIIAVRAR